MWVSLLTILHIFTHCSHEEIISFIITQRRKLHVWTLYQTLSYVPLPLADFLYLFSATNKHMNKLLSVSSVSLSKKLPKLRVVLENSWICSCCQKWSQSCVPQTLQVGYTRCYDNIFLCSISLSLLIYYGIE